MFSRVLFCLLFFTQLPNQSSGQILRKWNGEVIPGTEDINLGPGVDLDGLDLYGAWLRGVDLSNASFVGTNLTYADVAEVPLHNANFTDAILMGTNLTDTTGQGFTEEQLYDTASYQAHDLRGIWLRGIDLSRWDFGGQDLTEALLGYSRLADAIFTDAIVTGIDLTEVTIGGFVAEQLYSTASYQSGYLQGLRFRHNDLKDWNMSNLDLSNSRLGRWLEGTDFSNSNLYGALIEGSSFEGTNFAGVDLRGARFRARSQSADLNLAHFTAETIYDGNTVFPPGFSPTDAGLTLVPEPNGIVTAALSILAVLSSLQRKVCRAALSGTKSAY